VGRWKKNLLEKAGSVIYVQEENWETSITIFLKLPPFEDISMDEFHICLN
jgi:hypothetical protein